MPRPLLGLLALASPTLRALREVAYQVRRPWIVDDGKFARTFGAAATPHPGAMRRTIAWYRSQM